jgi:hypothetical protein
MYFCTELEDFRNFATLVQICEKRRFLCQPQASVEQNPLPILQNWKNLNIEQYYQSTKQAAQLGIREKLLKENCDKLFSNNLNVLR